MSEPLPTITLKDLTDGQRRIARMMQQEIEGTRVNGSAQELRDKATALALSIDKLATLEGLMPRVVLPPESERDLNERLERVIDLLTQMSAQLACARW